jgi:FixJ family two-component response regulator
MTTRAKRATSPLAVAIVDDEPSIRTSLCRLCEALGMRPTAYASGPEFIAALERPGGRPDCLLLDAHMPEMTGLEVQEHLVRSGALFPTIVITADDAPEAEQRFHAAGIAAYLQKPVGCDELVAALEQATRSKPPPP